MKIILNYFTLIYTSLFVPCCMLVVLRPIFWDCLFFQIYWFIKTGKSLIKNHCLSRETKRVKNSVYFCTFQLVPIVSSIKQTNKMWNIEELKKTNKLSAQISIEKLENGRIVE